MDSFKRVRESRVLLTSTDLTGLRAELEDHLSRISSRTPKDITLQSHCIPMGVSGFVKAGEELSAIMPFPLAGTLQDFMSFVSEGVKEVFVQITAVSRIGSQRVETRLMDSFRVYPTLRAEVGSTSYVKVKIMNRSKVDTDCIVGFTFKEVIQNEIKATRLIGDLEGGTVS